jgi:hypothetical protein
MERSNPQRRSKPPLGLEFGVWGVGCRVPSFGFEVTRSVGVKPVLVSQQRVAPSICPLAPSESDQGPQIRTCIRVWG